jgi:hypothetical protein
VKVAQYEVLRTKQKRDARPASPENFRVQGRSKHSVFGLPHGSAIVSIRRSSRPGRIAL